MQDRLKPEQPALIRWVMGVFHPVESFGDYFERLERSVRSSAPPCTTCG